MTTSTTDLLGGRTGSLLLYGAGSVALAYLGRFLYRFFTIRLLFRRLKAQGLVSWLSFFMSRFDLRLPALL